MGNNAELELSRIFIKVIQQGSFSKAAAILQVPKSTVSKAITKLEKETGTKLILRTTRSLTLTPVGRAYYDKCVEPFQMLEEAQKSLYGADQILSGTIRITAPEDFGNYVVSNAIAELIKKYPQLNFDLRYTNEVIDLVKDGFDLAIRLGSLKENRLKAKRIGENNLILVASNKYLKSAPLIRHPKDLIHHNAMSVTPLFNKWALQSKKSSLTVPVHSRVVCNQMTSLVSTALAGAGIALVPAFVCKPELESGKLIRVLPEWTSQGWPVALVSPLSSTSSARLKVTIDHLFTAIQDALVV